MTQVCQAASKLEIHNLKYNEGPSRTKYKVDPYQICLRSLRKQSRNSREDHSRGNLELDLELHLELDLDLGLDLELHLDLDSKTSIIVERG